MKQTAVEWLEEELADKLKSIILNNDYKTMENLFEQAKYIEKQNIEKSIDDALNAYGLIKTYKQD